MPQENPRILPEAWYDTTRQASPAEGRRNGTAGSATASEIPEMQAQMNQQQTPAVGVIGLGLIGSAVAERLLASGRSVRGFDPDNSKAAALAASGGTPHDSASDVFETSDAVLLCVPTSRVVADLLSDAHTMLHSGQLLLDLTTGDPDEIERTGYALAQRDIEYLEVKVAGSSQQLRQGEAVLLLGGSPKSLQRAESLLDVLGSRRFVLGGIGDAARFKLVHNLILGLHRAVLAEGLQFAAALGFDAEQALQILQQTPAASRVMESKGARMIHGEYSPHATLAQHLKDVRLIREEASRRGAFTPLSEIHQQILEQAVKDGWAEADNSAVVEVFRARNGKGLSDRE